MKFYFVPKIVRYDLKHDWYIAVITAVIIANNVKYVKPLTIEMKNKNVISRVGILDMAFYK